MAFLIRARTAVVALPVALLVSACVASAARAAEFVDDARRRVSLPDAPARVFAAGAPAELLLYTLVPEMLVGRNHEPSAAARALLPPEYRSLTPITNLPDRDDARYDAELITLRPNVYVDYGTVDADYVAALEAVSNRTGVPGVILDGRLADIPGVYRRLGAALGVAEHGERLAKLTRSILDKYRASLSGTTVRVYVACSQDGRVPCYEDQSGGEAAAWLGATNVAGASAAAPRRPLTIEEIRSAAPTVIIAPDPARLRTQPEWQSIAAVAANRLHAPPALPFNWGPRPPSVNRLLGLVWLAYVLPGRELDEVFFVDVAALFEALYHVEVSREQIRGLVAGE